MWDLLINITLLWLPLVSSDWGIAMHVEKLKKIFNAVAIHDRNDMNPLVAAEGQEFDRLDDPNETKSYRDRAIDLVVRHKLPFSSTLSTNYELFQRYVQLVCPYCATSMKLVNGGGNFAAVCVEYRCNACQATVSLALLHGGFSASPSGQP